MKLGVRLIIFMLCLGICSTCFAVTNYNYNNAKTCAVIIGDADVKTRNYLGYTNDFLELYNVSFGEDIQTLWVTYWLDKGELEEGRLNKDVMLDFCKYSGYDKVLFIVVDNHVIEKTRTVDFFLGDVEHTRSSMEIKALLVDSNQIIKTINRIDEDDSATSEKRAKRGAFKKCMRDIVNDLSGYLK